MKLTAGDARAILAFGVIPILAIVGALISGCSELELLPEAHAELKPVATGYNCQNAVCAPRWSRGWAITAGGAVECLAEESGGQEQLLVYGAQLICHCTQPCALFYTLGQAADLSINTTTLVVTDADSGAGVPDIDGNGTFSDNAVDGSAGAVWADPSVAMVLGRNFGSLASVGKRCGVCATAEAPADLVTNGRPCGVDADCTDADTSGFDQCRGCGAGTPADNTNHHNSILGGFVCGDCTADATCRCWSE